MSLRRRRTSRASHRSRRLFGGALILVGAKFWVFTLGAIAAIGDADLGQPTATVTFGVFVVLAASIQLALIGIAFALPSESDDALVRISEWLSRHNRTIVIALGLVFGTWFMIKAWTDSV